VSFVCNGEPAACCWTDPPYGVEYVGGTKDHLTIRNDTADGLARLLAPSFANVRDALVPGGAFYIAEPAGALHVEFGNAVIAAGLHLHEMVIWVKDRLVLGHSDYHLRHEGVLYGWKPGADRAWYAGRSEDSVFEVPRASVNAEHPTAKPVALVTAMLKNSTKHGDLVLDPFLGSGTTLIAAEQLGRRCAGIELDPRYVDVAVARFEAFTGKKAERVPAGDQDRGIFGSLAASLERAVSG
jgi:site-specific DNA-methyltransferase (adenine-specific)